MFRSILEEQVAAAEAALREAVGQLDPDDVPASEASRLFDRFDQIVRTATAARTLLARRVDDSMEWRRLGFHSAAELMAARSGTSLGAARTEMETSEALRSLPATRDRLLDGSLSAAQGATIAGAAKVNPSAEPHLLETARTANLYELRGEAQRAKAAADPDPEATHARIHRERRGTRCTDDEGARLLKLRGPAELAAVIEAELDRLTDQIFRARGKAGTTECRDAYVYDAAVEMARRSARADDRPSGGGRRQPRAEHLALLRLDIAALRRGRPEEDELCEITGVGPIPVATAKELLGDAVLKLVLTNGADVAHVTSLTRSPTQAQRYAMLWTSPTCTVEGCSRTIIEYDHVHGAEFRTTKHTRLDETEPVCPGHHDLTPITDGPSWLAAGSGRWSRPTILATPATDHPASERDRAHRADTATARPDPGPLLARRSTYASTVIDVPAGQLYLGEGIDAAHARTGEPVLLKAADLTTHGVVVGMTGSGKTGLGVALLEEALLQGIPTLILDPKGDLGNLLLTFPDLAAESFAPWVDGADADAVAAAWKDGLAGWGIDGSRLQALRDAATFTIYTPGSTSGVGLDVMGSLQRPPDGTDSETMADEVEGYVTGLLGLVGIEADPLSSREHILLATIVQQAWTAGHDLDLAGLVGQVQAPPLRKLGVFELDEFFPPADRTKLALQLNGLLASPAFAAWGQGEPLDIERLLRPQGKPGCAIVSLSHLADEERQFVVTLVLAKLITWMRRQPGTDQLRALVYFDEVVGFVPPTAAPPAKAPILTILKQARAFGVGLVLATQNPVDVDYKALSNAGTWAIGRLQTEQDKARLLDGLAAAAGGVDTAAMSRTIAGLDKREFVLRQAGRDAPTTFTSRWAMSYLRGPLTREQIATLMADRRQVAPTEAEDAPPGSSRPAVAASVAPAGAQDDPTPVMPAVAEGIAVRWLDPAAPWSSQVGSNPGSLHHRAALVATVDLLFDDAKADLRHTEQVECLLSPLREPPDLSSLLAVDHDPRDLRSEPPAGATYALPEAKVSSKAFFTSASRAIVDHLLATRTVDLLTNRELKLISRPGEEEAAFAARCDAAADALADRAAAAMAKRFEARIARARAAVATAEDRARQAEAARSTRQTDELLTGAGDLLGAVLGGRRSARSIARKVGSLASRRGRVGEADQRAESASNRVGEKAQALAYLEADMAEELTAIAADADAKALATEPLAIPLEKSDIRVSSLALVWIPV